MLAIDTNVLVRVIVQDDRPQAETALRAIGAGAWVSNVVLAEALWVLKSYYGRSHAEIANTVEELLKHNAIALQDEEAVAAALATYRRNRKVSFSDCLLLEVARKAGHTPLGSFDRDLAKVDGVQRLDRAND